jgi:hypothetical protein
MVMAYARTPLLVRFLEKVLVPSDAAECCWLWVGASDRHGYGNITEGGHAGPHITAHRLAWELANGPAPRGAVVRHRCDNPSCVRPSHLAIGTMADNQRDMAVRQRGTKGKLPWGVSACNEGRQFCVKARVAGRSYYLGCFPTLDEAALVAQDLRKQLYG